MGMETRGSGRYYYEKYRDSSGRVRSRYWGGGRVAELCGQLDALTREGKQREREAEREAIDRARESAREIETKIDDGARRLDELVTAHLLAAGYHKHKG